MHVNYHILNIHIMYDKLLEFFEKVNFHCFHFKCFGLFLFLKKSNFLLVVQYKVGKYSASMCGRCIMTCNIVDIYLGDIQITRICSKINRNNNMSVLIIQNSNRLKKFNV